MRTRAGYILTTLIVLLLCFNSADAQRRVRQNERAQAKAIAEAKAQEEKFGITVFQDTTKKVITDSMRMVLDSLHRADSLWKVDSIALMGESSLQAPAFTEAKDSLVEDFSNGRQLLKYYGGVTVKYGDMSLTADYIEYDVQSQTVYAKGVKDPVSGEMKGEPVMQDASGKYEMKEVKYNFDSKKAFIKNMVTNDSNGILRGNNIKMMPDQSINITQGKYTVCDCEEPHYYIKLTAAKVMTKPKRTTVFGPAWPVVEGVPLFPIVLPFGFIPTRPERASGILMPTFGEEQARGFYFRDLGIYFVIGDYFDVSLTGSYFTMGSWGLDFNSRYKVNYKFGGNISVNYSFDQVGEKGEPDSQSSTNFGVKWSHQQDSKAHPGATFSASVNFQSPLNNRYNSRNVTEALNNQIGSSISYSRNFNGKFNLSVNALHSQNTKDSSYSITLPNLTFSVSKFYPFKRKHRVGKEKFYEKFSLSYNTSFTNRIAFKTSEIKQPRFLDKMQNGMQHNFSIGLPNFTLFKYININPSVSYGMNWFFSSKEKYFNPETNKVEDKKGGVFSTFGATHNYSGSISMDTQVYGMYTFNKWSKVQAIRHVMKPSVSMSFSPEKGTYFNGWRTLDYVDTLGVPHSVDYNIYEGQSGSYPGKGKSATASFSLGNNLEMKVKDYKDTTGTGSKKIKLLDQLNFNGSYNFLADSMRLSNIGVTVSTNIFGKVGVSGNLNFDPYAINEKGQRIAKFALTENHKLLRLTNASFSLSYSITGKGKINGNDGNKNGSGGGSGSGSGGSTVAYNRVYYHPITGEYIPGGWLYYTNPDAPWSLNLSYSFNYARSYQYTNEQLMTNNNITQTLNLSGNVKVTPRLSLNATTGFDVQALKITTTQLSASYDLHCFNIQFSWVPTGKWKSWNFTIAANAAALADILRFRKSSSFWDNQ